ncbi:hypothetical protein BGX30_003617 [Mortierella sp. GBA39]|nr:hypothetical protein BGX30_003617 [Mortierella sp. GBA39]
MNDDIQHLKDDQPRYFGVTTQLNKEMLYGETSSDEESFDQAVDDYFFDTPVCQWSVRNFLKNHGDSTLFIAGVDKIRRLRSVDKAIQTYATSWFKFVEGDLGKLRLEAFAAETRTSVTSGTIVEEERHLAQQRLRGHLREAKALAPHELVHTIPLLGKREREEETEAQEDGFANSPTYKKRAISPFEKEFLNGCRLEDEKDEDAVTLVQERSHHPLNMVFDCQLVSFACAVGEQVVSRRFTDYYEDAMALPCDCHSFEDFLKVALIVVAHKLAGAALREDLEKLRKAVILGVEPNKHKDMLANQQDQAVEFCQVARNTLRKAERNVGANQARKLLKQRIAQEEDSPLNDLYEYAAKLPQDCQPVSEADQTSSFVLGMLRLLFDRPDCSRLAHTATTATSGSLFVRLCKNLENAPKHPDLFVRYRESTDVGVAEITLELCAQKDIGDLCRVALRSKRILDELVARMEITEEAQVLFFQAIGKNCTFYAMRRSGTVCVAVEMANIKIAYTISDVLAGFEEDVRGWLLIDRTFQNLVSTLQSAMPRKAHSPPPLSSQGSAPRDLAA